MLAACGTLNGVVVHPSGQYLFIGNSNISATEIEKIDYSQKKIVDTGNQVPYIQDISGQLGPPLSPNGTPVFTTNYKSHGYYLQVSGFNVSTGLTSGATIYAPSSIPNNWRMLTSPPRGFKRTF
jgi:DNA-binding beta-propeller fold protein YncE